LNVCELYERGPVVLALFVEAGSCPGVLSEMEALVPEFPGVGFAAVAVKGERAPLRRLIAARGLRFPVGFDRDGALARLYGVASCPQITLAYPGGIVQSRALLGEPSPGVLRARIAELVGAARARGWRR
jgi:peroxiredoxin